MADQQARRSGDAAGLLSGESWSALCRILDEARERVLGEDVPDDPRSRAEGFRYLARFLQAGLVSCVSHDDPDHPVFGRMIDYTMPWGLDNPDCLYLYAPVRGDARYRIRGQRGSASHIDIQVNTGHYSDGQVAAVRTIDSIDGFGLVCDDDGRFELSLGGEVGAGSHLSLSPDAEFVLVRQYFADWDNERPADLSIERSDAVLPAPPPTPEAVAGQLERLGRWMERGAALWEQMSRSFLAMAPNSLVIHRAEDAGEHSGMRGQAYGIGNFQCADDEAVVLELAPPVCHHWGVSLANYYWECVEYATRQSSLNGHQAVLDDDGIFRAVISQRDPGIANWLDPAGNRRGTLTARFLKAEAAPEVRFRLVPFEEIEAALPPSTRRVTPEVRARMLESRRRAVVRRFRE